MFCNKCGAKNDDSSKFCSSCGAKIEFLSKNESTQVANPTPVAKPVVQATEILTLEQIQPTQSTIDPIVYAAPAVAKTNIQASVEQSAEPSTSKTTQTTKSVAPEHKPVGPATPNVAKKKKLNPLVIILPIVLVIIIGLAVAAFLILNGLKNKFFDGVDNFFGEIENEISDNLSGGTWEGDGFTLEYGPLWRETEMAGGQEALDYMRQDAFLIYTGMSNLSDYTELIGENFDSNSTTRKNLYDEFQKYWSPQMEDKGLVVFESDFTSFKKLSGGIYYAMFDYGKTEDYSKGKLIILVEPEKDAVLSFTTNAIEGYETLTDTAAIELLKDIEIDDINRDYTVVKDDELAGMLDSLANWNMYKSVREGSKLGTVKKLDGGWRALSSEGQAYWEFKGNEFWWYKSYEDLKDNYWYGTTEILTGKEGFKKVGLDENKVTQIYTQSNGKTKADDVYTVIFTPTKIITGGEDKSATNITGENWKFVWILVDHGDEGIEAQTMNVYNGDTNFYVKIKD